MSNIRPIFEFSSTLISLISTIILLLSYIHSRAKKPKAQSMRQSSFIWSQYKWVRGIAS